EVAEDPIAGGDDRIRGLVIHRLELTIRERRRFFKFDEDADERWMFAQSADRIVLDRALRLRAVQRVVGDGDFAEGIFFDSHAFNASSFAFDSSNTFLCSDSPCASIVTIAMKSSTQRCQIASGDPRSSQSTASTRLIDAAQTCAAPPIACR